MKNYENINLEKEMYNNPTKSFSQILEELDPSENYAGSNLGKLDAFQRQLKRFDIKVNNPSSDLVSKFHQNRNSSILFPEFLARCVKKGMEGNTVLENIVATTSQIDSLNYHNITINTKEKKDETMEIVEENQAIPETQLTVNEENIKLKKMCSMLTASYEAIEFQSIGAFAIRLKRIGHCLCNAIIKAAIDVLINGDNKENAAEILKTKEKDKITYEDLLQMWAKFETFEMNTIIANHKMLTKLAEIEELKNPLSKLNFPTNGTMTTPLGANIVRTNIAPENSIIFIDKNFALNQLVAKDITIEADTLIEKQTSRNVIYTIVGFAKICKGASCVLTMGENKE